MKKILMLTLATAVLLSAGNIMAADYSQHSTEELSKMRGTMQNATTEERDAFRTEWQKRTQDMPRLKEAKKFPSTLMSGEEEQEKFKQEVEEDRAPYVYDEDPHE